MQLGTPREVYEQPQTHYVADFVGSANFLPGEIAAQEDDITVVKTPLGFARAPSRELVGDVGDRVEVFFRPEHCTVSATVAEGPNTWRCTVEASLFLGPNYEYVLEAAGIRLLAWTTSSVVRDQQRDVWITVPSDRILLLSQGVPGSSDRAT